MALLRIRKPDGEIVEIASLPGKKGDKGEKGDTGEQGIQGIQGIQGDKGEAGYTPQKGVDYFTAEEQAAFVAAANAHTDERLGDVEAALDGIIAIQGSLIGGDAE